MHTRGMVVAAIVLAAPLLPGGGPIGPLGVSNSSAEILRPTNIEIRILSQSSFQGEIEPCG